MATQDAGQPSIPRHPISASDKELVLSELARLVADGRFANSPSLIRFLNYALGETLAARTIDPIVRVQAGKLRAKLQDYYEHQGAADPIRIEFLKGSYVPHFVPVDAGAAEAQAPAVARTEAAGASTTAAAARRQTRCSHERIACRLWRRAWSKRGVAALLRRARNRRQGA
jgi:hypothetical protein